MKRLTAYPCHKVYDTWWRGKPGCGGAGSEITVDAGWIRRTLEAYAVGFSAKHAVPVHCNQWGVKDEVFDFNLEEGIGTIDGDLEVRGLASGSGRKQRRP